jgi:hypothetical protein
LGKGRRKGTNGKGDTRRCVGGDKYDHSLYVYDNVMRKLNKYLKGLFSKI